MSHAIEVSGLNKSFGTVHAVRDLSFTAQPGRVTGFLGPNGSGKTTTLSMLLGLTRPDSGSATIGGKRYSQLDRPAYTVGASLSANFHAAHTGRAHLDIARRAIGVDRGRVDEVLNLVGLSDAGDRKTGGYSLGMRQRLALGAALLADPEVIVLDEPVNGLDPEGIRWIRMFLRYLASEGKTVLLSSHLLSEAQHTVDDVVVIRRGELAFAGSLADLRQGTRTVLVDAVTRRGRARLYAALTHAGGEVSNTAPHGTHAAGREARPAPAEPLSVSGLDPEQVGEIAFDVGVPLVHLSVPGTELERSFLELTGEPAADTAGDPATSIPAEGASK